mmetsp:Transcript_31458/g.27816  ORF Transcript_31458/g.27816 Transcript_31458/m.27816 type:complete len:121 (+) Transcript_31458:205-567(+)
MGVYRHSFSIIKTQPHFQEKYPDGEFYFFTVEKNDLGIVWHRYDNFKDALYSKNWHDGTYQKREGVKHWESKELGFGSLRISELKDLSGLKTEYNLLNDNCIHFAKHLGKILGKNKISQD